VVDAAPDYNDSLGGDNAHAILSVGDVTQVNLRVASPTATQRNIVVQNQGSKPVFLGESDVAKSGARKGFRLKPNALTRISLQRNSEVFAIAKSGTQDVFVWEFTV